LFEQGPGLRAVATVYDVVTFRAQRLAQPEPDMRVIFDDEKALFHFNGSLL
jgi:hypothetical protein